VVDDTLAGLVAAGYLARDTGAGRVTADTAAPIYRFGNRAHRSRLLEALPVQQGRRLHRRIARSVETAFGEFASDRSPELAVRYEQAYDVARAVRSYYDAAILCRRRGGQRIAHTHLGRALALLPGLGDSAERSAWEALLLTADGGELVARQGLGDVEVDGCFERALALAKEMTAGQGSFAILWRLWVFYLNRGPITKAHEVAGRLFEIARALDDPALELGAHHAFWGTALMLGDVRGILSHTREGIALCGAGLDGAAAITHGCTLHDAHVSNHHAAVCAGYCGAWAEALAGHQQDAKRSADAAITLARDFGHPFSLAKALVQSAGALAAGGDTVNTRRYASEGGSIARDHGFAVFQAWSSIYEGWAAARLGDTDEGLSTMYEGLAAFRGTGLWLFRPFQLALAAEIELENRMYDAAARSLDEAFAIAGEVGDGLAVAELHRLRGELAIATGTTPDHLVDAECDLRAAVDIAAETGAERVRIAAARSLQRFERTDGSRRGEPAGRVRAVADLADRRRGRDA
jgi:tetratricopeptide (TPR) repeat protein